MTNGGDKSGDGGGGAMGMAVVCTPAIHVMTSPAVPAMAGYITAVTPP